MNISTLIEQAKSDGVKFSLSEMGTLKLAGENEIVHQWVPIIREHKPEIIQTLQEPRHFLWRITLADGKTQTVSFTPEADQHEVMALYPQVFSVEPIIEERSATEPPMTDEEEQTILIWLTHIGEDDPVTIGEVIDRCRSHTEAREYFLGRAKEARQ